VASPCLNASRREDGRVDVRIGAAAGQAASPGTIALDLPLREGGARARAVARAVARRSGIALAFPAASAPAEPSPGPAQSNAAVALLV
jgi:hypothetical protein